MSRPAAIVLTPQQPWPTDDGGRVGLWQSVLTVARAYDTTLVTLEPERGPLPPPPRELGDRGIHLVRVPYSPPVLPFALARGVFGRWPYTLARYHSARVAHTLRDVTARVKPSLAFVNHLHLATYIPDLRPATVVLRQHNVESTWLTRWAASRRQPITRAFIAFQAARMRTAERVLCEEVDLVLAIHEEEAKLLRELAHNARVEVIPVAVEAQRFLPHAPVTPPRVLLAGAYGWPPNREGAERFIAEGWPHVHARVPEAVLRIVGKDLPSALAARALAAGAEPAGLVPHIEPEFAAASVLVVPLWVGAGMRVKIVEAMMASVPVVATPLAAEGLGVSHGRELLIAPDPAGLGNAVADLLVDRERAGALAEAARKHALDHWSLDVVAEATLAHCADVMRARGVES